MSTKPTRKLAPRIAKPVARYRPGKAPKGYEDAVGQDSDEDDEVEAGEGDEGVEDVAQEQSSDEEEEDDGGMALKTAPAAKQGKGMTLNLKQVDISKDGKVIIGGREESGRTAMEESEEESDEEEPAAPQAGAEGEGESSEYESSSEEEEQKPMFRPVFVPKRGRVTVLEREQDNPDSEEAQEKRRLEEEERKQQSHDMVAETIRRELAEKEKENETPDIDDTDGLDPEEEFESWRLRELSRIKRDKAEQIAREEEREEIERRRALPEEQRMKEDLEHAQKSRDEKSKGQQKFLQKYWHKGAFHQDEEILSRHDYTQATESTVDVSMLPKVMQVRNFGKRSRTKYTHLVDQDTTATTGGFGGTAFSKPGAKPGESGAGCFLCGGPHMKKDCPQYLNGPPGTGANGVDNFSKSRGWGDERRRDDDGRRWNDRPRDRSPRRDRDDDRYEDDRSKGRLDYDREERDRRDRYDSRDSRRDDRGHDRRYDDRRSSRRSRSRSPARNDYDHYDRERDDRREKGDYPEDDRRGKRLRTD